MIATMTDAPVVRPYQRGEEQKMAALVNASLADEHSLTVTEDMIHEEWTDPRLALDNDTWVAVAADGRYIAAVEVWFEGDVPPSDDGPVTRHIGFTVHPDYRESHHALFTELLERGLQHALERPFVDPTRPAVLRAWASAHDAWKQGWIARYGFQYVGCGFTMIHDQLDDLPPLPAVPHVEIRRWQPQLDYDLWQVLNDCFVDDPTYQTMTWEDWNRTYHESPNANPNLWHVAVDSRSDEIIGFVLCEINDIALDIGLPQEGWITDLAVLPAWRGRGVRALLLGAALQSMAAEGVEAVLAGVGSFSPTVATRHFDALKFRILRGVCTYLRPIG
ncbi:MAG: GNAT family N-acetyltransferase [Anaerolineales bacterium]|nr:GNAT family N-acetyltransferase [Anaerolineales bacterium]